MKYLENGQEVEVVEELKNGSFLVQRIYETGFEGADGDEFGHQLGDLIIVPKIFNEPPVAKLNLRVVELNNQIEGLAEKLKLLHKEYNTFLETKKSIDSKLDQYKALQGVFDLIDGKMTHYIIKNYNGYEIVDWFFDHCNSEDRHSRTAKKKLLTLFGDSNGNLEWKLNEYKDGSGCGTVFCWWATSYENAISQLTELLNIEFQDDVYKEGIIKSAEKYGIEVPANYREGVKQLKIKSLSAQVKELEKKLADVHEKIIETC